MTATVSPYDSMIPKVPEVRVEDIKALFKVQHLPKIDGRPSYGPLDDAREILCRNGTAIETSLGGGNHGHLGLVLKPAVYLVEAGVAFNVPASAGIFPTFAQGANEQVKRDAVANFIVSERDIKKAKIVEDLLRNQLMEAVDEEYYLELKNPTYRYDRVKVRDMLTHLFDNYGKLDESMVRQNKRDFEEAPDLSRPIDVYYERLQKCQKISEDAGYPITANDLIL